MKKSIAILLTLALAAGGLFAQEKQQPGPRGGLLLKTDPRAEFLVTHERKVEITFLDSELKKIAPGERSVRVTALAPAGRKTLELELLENVFVSKESLPEGDGYTIVAQIYPAPGARPENFRIVYEEHVCSGCDLMEYACTCGH